MQLTKKILRLRAGLLVLLTHRITLPLLKRLRMPGSFSIGTHGNAEKQNIQYQLNPLLW